MSGVVPVRRAILSVAEKAGLLPFAQVLSGLGIQLVSTGSTAALLAEAGIPVVAVSDVTGFPEMLDGRVKTLHPAIHGGILADRRKPEHVEQLAAQGILPIDLVVVSLYPVPRDGPRGGRLRRGHRADRHRRPDAGSRRGQELRSPSASW